MNELARQIIVYSAAEQLAKDAEFKGSGIAPYLARSKSYYAGDETAFTARQRQTMRIQELHLADDERTVLKENPELISKYTESDRHQLDAASDNKNLDYYLEQGVDYKFNHCRINELLPLLDIAKPLSVQLMRERIVGIPGLGSVRLNVLYHDMMDHLWSISQMREAGLDSRYADFIAEIGNPFTGFLFSKQAELLSGIGYNTRRFVTNADHYGSMALSKDSLIDHLKVGAENDERITRTVAKINDSENLARAAGFVFNGALGSLLLQRSRDGAVKKIVKGTDGPELTNTPVSLLDTRYLSLMIDAVDVLLAKEPEYRQMQLDLNLTVESLLRECLERNLDLGHLALGKGRGTSNIPTVVSEELIQNAGASTSYYS